VTRGLWAQFGPKRVKDTPISEAAMVGLSNGAAFTGMRPVVEIMYADFISECFDQIVNIAAKTRYMFGGQHKVSMVLRTPSVPGCVSAFTILKRSKAGFLMFPV
jgi:pyruvate/2-oxoglutarate/acetoin dehydrogenase E1 component